MAPYWLGVSKVVWSGTEYVEVEAMQTVTRSAHWLPIKLSLQLVTTKPEPQVHNPSRRTLSGIHGVPPDASICYPAHHTGTTDGVLLQVLHLQEHRECHKRPVQDAPGPGVVLPNRCNILDLLQAPGIEHVLQVACSFAPPPPAHAPLTHSTCAASDDFAIEHEYLVAVVGVIALFGFIFRSVRVQFFLVHAAHGATLSKLTMSTLSSLRVQCEPNPRSGPCLTVGDASPVVCPLRLSTSPHSLAQVKIVYRSIMSGSLFLCKPCVRLAVRNRIRREHNEKVRKKAHERSVQLAAEKAKAAEEEKRIAIAQAERTKHLKADATKKTVAISGHLLPEVGLVCDSLGVGKTALCCGDCSPMYWRSSDALGDH